MTRNARRARTERLLAARLDELGRALDAGRPVRADAARLVESASAATMRAVSLRLLSRREAAAIWSDASRRNPTLGAAARRAGAPLARAGTPYS